MILDDQKNGESEEEKLVKSDVLSSFLSSSLNVELVYILLKSITTFSKKNSISNNEIKVLSKNEASKDKF